MTNLLFVTRNDNLIRIELKLNERGYDSEGFGRLDLLFIIMISVGIDCVVTAIWVLVWHLFCSADL